MCCTSAACHASQIIINIYIEKGKVQNGQNIKINIYIYNKIKTMSEGDITGSGGSTIHGILVIVAAIIGVLGYIIRSRLNTLEHF